MLDAGGSMDAHVQSCEELFSACRSEFKHLEFYYFHNCVYESVWRDNRLRHAARIPTAKLLNTYSADYKLVFVGDASMSPYELVYAGGAIEHWNEESGEVWLRRFLQTWSKAVWLNPAPQRSWLYTQSIGMIRKLMAERMYPLTLAGLDDAIRELSH
jgi:hypothetical protein